MIFYFREMELIGQILKSRLEPREEDEHFKLVSSVTGHQMMDFNINFFEKWCREIERKLKMPNMGNLEKEAETFFPRSSFLGSKHFTALLEIIVTDMMSLPRTTSRDGFLMIVARGFLEFYGNSTVSHVDLDEDGLSGLERTHFRICGLLFERYPEVIETEVSRLPSAPDHSPAKGFCRLLFGVCSSNEVVCQRVWNSIRAMQPTPLPLLEVFVTRTKLTRSVLNNMYGEQLSILVQELLENPLGLTRKACQHCIHKAMQRLSDRDLSTTNPERQKWLPSEFPAWGITAPIMCFLAEGQFLKSTIKLCHLLSTTARAISKDEIESLITNLRCLSEKTSLNFDELKFSVACHGLGRKRSFEESDDGFSTRGPPGKKRIICDVQAGVESFPVAIDPRPFSSQPVPKVQPNSNSELVEELLCYFVISQRADKVPRTYELVLKLPGFERRERFLLEKLSAISERVTRLRPNWDVDWVDHIADNVACLLNHKMTS